jgi:uncharacterized membrane protein YbaN (DUF454 family)
MGYWLFAVSLSGGFLRVLTPSHFQHNSVNINCRVMLIISAVYQKMFFFAGMEPNKAEKPHVRRSFSRKVKVTPSRPLKWFYILLGTLSVGLGFVGIFVPVLPTTAFLLLAAWFYARSSERFYNWLLGNRLFGKYLTSYLEGRGVSLKTKILSLSVLWITIIISVIFFVENIYVDLLLLAIAAGVSYHILKLPVDKG